jgi:hypothetical protein
MHIGLCVCSGLFDITGNVESVTRGLRDSESVVESDTAWDSTEATASVRDETKMSERTYTITRHILSTASWQSPKQVAGLLPRRRDSLKPAVTIKAIMAATNWPMPCIAKTAFIIAPLHFVVANSDVIIEDNG